MSTAQRLISAADHAAARQARFNSRNRVNKIALFLSLAETTIEFASREPQRADKFKALGFEAMWLALAEGD